MSVASRAYTEHDVEEFFDTTLPAYLNFWDTEGVLHTGYFAEDNRDDYRAAARQASAMLAAEARIDGSSRVLDVGSGCGNFLMYLARQYGCSGEGLDLSEERVKFAMGRLAGQQGLRITFRHGSATQMPYQPGVARR
jgi:sarcosine/dimethylglycine N-methyltransferase